MTNNTLIAVDPHNTQTVASHTADTLDSVYSALQGLCDAAAGDALHWRYMFVPEMAEGMLYDDQGDTVALIFWAAVA